MKLINKESINFFHNLQEINDGFRIPDEAYVHGKDFHCFENLGADCYFSNYWYGAKNNVQSFAEELALYLKTEYEKIVPEEGRYDFYGIVAVWYIGDNAVVGSINLEPSLSCLQDEMPASLKKLLKNTKLNILLDDGSDNSALDLLYAEVSKKIKGELLDCVAEKFKPYYITSAQQKGIKI
jgi:hypothetical protein